MGRSAGGEGDRVASADAGGDDGAHGPESTGRGDDPDRVGTQPREDEPGGASEPDVLLDVPHLSVDEIHLEVEDLRAHVSLQAEVLDLVKLNVGADVDLGRVSLTITGVEAEALLKVRLDTVARILGRVLTTIDRNPQILEQIVRSVEPAIEGVGEAAGELGRGAGGAVEHAGEGAGEAVRHVGRGAEGAVDELGSGAGQAARDVGRGTSEAVEDVGSTAANAGRDVARTVRDTTSTGSEDTREAGDEERDSGAESDREEGPPRRERPPAGSPSDSGEPGRDVRKRRRDPPSRPRMSRRRDRPP